MNLEHVPPTHPTVDRCRPYFICMLGERYGWAQAEEAALDELLHRTFEKALPSYPWIGNLRDRSITELEIRHAILNDLSDRATDHTLFYLRDPSYMPADAYVLFYYICRTIVITYTLTTTAYTHINVITRDCTK